MTNPTAVIDWIDDDIIRVGDTEFLVTADPGVYGTATSSEERFLLVKDARYLASSVERFLTLEPRNVLELGVYQGGSVVFWNLVLRPERQLAIDIYDRSVEPLGDFLASELVHGHLDVDCAVDQGDVAVLSAALDRTFGVEQLDLVIDDASHRYFESRVSFETVFPRVRAGGRYVIEDWGWAHRDMSWDVDGDFWTRPALSNLLIELALVCTARPDVVSKVEIDSEAVYVERGPAELHGPLRLAALYANRGVPFRPLL